MMENNNINLALSDVRDAFGISDTDKPQIVNETIIEHVYDVIKEHIGEVAANNFISSKVITVSKNSNPVIQKTAIIRYISTKLFVYRAVSDLSIKDIIGPLTDIADISDWYRSFVNEVIPFLKTHDILSEMAVA